MKKLIFTFIFACLSVFMLCGKTNDKIQASATGYNLSLDVEKLTANDGDAKNLTQAGDFRINIKIADNQGLAGFGFQLRYSSDFVAITETGHPSVSTYKSGNVGIGLIVCNANSTDRKLAVSGATSSLVYNDGTIVTVYLRPVNAATLTEAKIQGMITGFTVKSMDLLHQQVIPPTDYTSPSGYTELLPYMIGDINGDGVVNISDAIALMSALNNHSYTVSTAGNHFASCYGMYVGENNDYFVFAVGDVNGDGFINSDDSDDILEYYNDVYVAGFDYNGDIATTENYTVTVNFS